MLYDASPALRHGHHGQSQHWDCGLLTKCSGVLGNEFEKGLSLEKETGEKQWALLEITREENFFQKADAHSSHLRRAEIHLPTGCTLVS